MRYLAALCLSAVATFAQAGNFVSVHQSGLRIALPPTAGSFNYTFDNKVGFKQQYAPTGVTGCAIGFGTTGCAFPGGGSLSLPEFTGYQLQAQEFKVYIPAGTRSFLFSGYAPQGTQSAFVLRYGKEPTRVAALNTAEYYAAQSAERIDTSFSRLVKEDADHFVVHDGGGTLRFVGGQLDSSRNSTDQGQWLYVRQLSGSVLYDYQGALDVDMPKYAAGYANITWTSSTYPDPVDVASPGGGGTTNPGGGGSTNPPVTADGVTTKVVSAAGQSLKLDITLNQSAADVTANPQISTWVAARIPANGLFFTTDVWFFRKSNGWAQLQLPNLDSVAYSSHGSNSTSVKLSPTLDLTDADLRAFNVEVYFGYKTSTGAFVNKGKIWPQ